MENARENEGTPFKNPEFLRVMEAIPGVVVGCDTSGFNEKEYQRTLEAYTAKNRWLFEKLDQICREYPQAQNEAVSLVCERLMDAVEADLADPARKRGINGRALQLDTYKMVILTYLTPAVFKMELGISRLFVERFHEEWLKRYPKQPYQVVTEQEIAAGFGRKWYQCYITQAVCGWLGKADDGYELTAFRNFRDGYLSTCPDGKTLIEEYYRDAPGIVLGIELCGMGDEVYPELWRRFLKPCLADIENGCYESCKNRYVRMVEELRERVLGRTP